MRKLIRFNDSHKTQKEITNIMVVVDLWNHIYLEILKEIENRSNKLGYNLLIVNNDDAQNRNLSLFKNMKDFKVDGFILIGDKFDLYDLEKIFQSEKPLIFIDNKIAKEGCYKIHIDYKKIIKDVLNYLAEKGFNNIGYIGSELSQSILAPLNSKYLVCLS